MYQLRAKVMNVFTVEPTEKRPEKGHKVQLVGDMFTKDGQTRLEMVTMSCPADSFERFKDLLGCEVLIPVGLFVADGRMMPYFPKHAEGLVEVVS